MSLRNKRSGNLSMGNVTGENNNIINANAPVSIINANAPVSIINANAPVSG